MANSAQKRAVTAVPARPGVMTYWHTLRHLRPVQVFGRLRFRLYRPRVDLSPAPARRASAAPWTPPAAGRTHLLGPTRFSFLNETRDLEQHGWDDSRLEKLWRYNLHYFADLIAADAGDRREWHHALLRRWVKENPPGRGTGWEPYPLSLRVVNWIKWTLAGNDLPAECLQSLAVQLRWLAGRLEHHLLGNHLFVNAKALVFGGCFFSGPEADRWLRRGLEILAREIPEQILADGAQFELSPMYHSLALEDMLDLRNISATFVPGLPAAWTPRLAGWWQRIGAMRAWLAAMCHPDGEIGFFNDAAIGIAPAPAVLEAYATRLGLPASFPARDGVTLLPASGYIRVQQGEGLALLDVARVGPDYMPGHAHADTLAFEFSLGGQRVLVNSGTSRYGLGAERLRQRGTSAHNTVTIGGLDSSEVWSGFRVARRARPFGLVVKEGPEPEVTCAHDGYRWLPGSPGHTRRWIFRPGALTVEDEVRAPTEVAAAARFHLHPRVLVNDATTGQCRLLLPNGRKLGVTVRGGRLRVEPTSWHPAFGVAEPSHCLVVDFGAGKIETLFRWEQAS